MTCTHCNDGKKIPTDFVDSGGRLPIFSCPQCTSCISHNAIVAALRAVSPDGNGREAIAKIIYDAFPFNGRWDLDKPKWVSGGNSIMQDEARKAANAILALRPTLHPRTAG